MQFSDGNANTKRCQSAFVTKLSPTGATVWSTYFGPTKQAGNGAFVIGNGVALDASDNVYVVGSSNLGTLPLVNPIISNSPQNDDAFVIEISPTAVTELMGTFLGANGNLTVNNNSLHLDAGLNAYISGYQSFCTNCTITFPFTPGAAITASTGGRADGWLLKLITQQQKSSTALQITPASGAPGTSIGFTATVTGLPAFATPTGTVALTSGATALGTINLVGGTGTFSTTSLTPGTYSVIATYSGDVVYAASATTAQTVSIQNTPTVALTATPSTTTVGTPVALKATVSSSAGTPTGTAYFMDGASTLGSMTLSGGIANYSATALAVGTHSITAHYGGDNNFVPLTSSAQTVTINPLAPTLTAAFSPSTLTIVHGSVGTSTLTLTPGNGFAGTLTFSCGTLPTSASCGFSPASLTFTATSSTPQSTTLSVSTTSAIIGMLHPAPLNPGLGNSLNGIAFGLLLMPLAFSRRARRAIRKRSVPTLALAFLAVLATGAFSGCSGSNTPATSTVTTTAPGTYTVTVSIAGAPSTTTPALQVTVQ